MTEITETPKGFTARYGVGYLHTDGQWSEEKNEETAYFLTRDAAVKALENAGIFAFA